MVFLAVFSGQKSEELPEYSSIAVALFFQEQVELESREVTSPTSSWTFLATLAAGEERIFLPISPCLLFRGKLNQQQPWSFADFRVGQESLLTYEGDQ